MNHFASESLADWVEQKPIWAPVAPVTIPEDDEPDEPGAALGDAEGQSFMIEYVDSSNRMSRRRITVWHIHEGGKSGIPSLYARCHERQAMRQCRIDRIRCCIDYDGEIHDDVSVYLSECFGMSISVARRKPEASEDAWNRLVGIVRTDATLLAALSRCDGQMAQSEIEVILVHLAKLAETELGIVADAELARLQQFVMRLRPTPRSIARALADAHSLSPDRLKRMLLTAARVMDADEVRHPQEVRLLQVASRELLGVSLL